MRHLFTKFRKTESGATLVEYGVALLVAIIVGGSAFALLASDVTTNVEDGSTQLGQR